jgi:Fe-S-cluster containining protein
MSPGPNFTASTRATTVSFSCSACGACCNSAPQLSLPELFHHEQRFIGTLAIRRIEPLASGVGPARALAATDAERVAFEALAGELCESVVGPNGQEFVLLAVQAFDDPERGRCPVLDAEKRCGIHFDRKPLGCRSVPLEALLPDSLQHAVLAERARDAAYFGANCIAFEERPGHLPIVSGGKVVSEEAAHALTHRRRELDEDRRFWGKTVFEHLRRELFDHPDRVAKLPRGGFLSLSLAPVLAVVASASPRCRTRCVGFLNAQIELTAEQLAPGGAAASAGAQRELAALLRASVALRTSLQRAAPLPRRPEADAVEAWLGLGPVAPEGTPVAGTQGAVS